MHLADAFIQSDLQCIHCSLGIEPTTFALQTQCSTTEPQEHRNRVPYQYFTLYCILLKTLGETPFSLDTEAFF